MAKNKLEDLTDHLFCMAEMLNDEELKGEDLREAVYKANALCSISEQIINTGKLAIEAAKISSDSMCVIKHPLLEHVSSQAAK